MRMSGGCRMAPWFTAAQLESGLDEGPRPPPAPPMPNEPANPGVPPLPKGFVPVAPAVVPACGESGGLNVHPAATTPNATASHRAAKRLDEPRGGFTFRVLTPVSAPRPQDLHRRLATDSAIGARGPASVFPPLDPPRPPPPAPPEHANVLRRAARGHAANG